jgi:hypothetical protein
MELTHLSEVSLVLLSSAATMTIMVVTVGAPSSSLEGAEPPPKKAHSRACLPVSSQYACVAVYLSSSFLLLPSSFLDSKR